MWFQISLGRSVDDTIHLRDELLAETDRLVTHPRLGQFEPLLDHLHQGHRRWVHGHVKIIYLILGDRLVVTDFFDSRQDPSLMHA